jgi:hypothetical protein
MHGITDNWNCPSNANTPGNMHEELGESNNDYENIPLNFAR